MIVVARNGRRLNYSRSMYTSWVKNNPPVLLAEWVSYLTERAPLSWKLAGTTLPTRRNRIRLSTISRGAGSQQEERWQFC